MNIEQLRKLIQDLPADTNIVIAFPDMTLGGLCVTSEIVAKYKDGELVLETE